MNENATLFGSVPVDVKLRSGESERVNVQQLTIGQLPKLLMAIDDEARSIELYCGTEPGWADTLTIESAVAVLAEGERINRDFFVQWALRRRTRAEWLVGAANGASAASPVGSPVSRSDSA